MSFKAGILSTLYIQIPQTSEGYSIKGTESTITTQPPTQQNEQSVINAAGRYTPNIMPNTSQINAEMPLQTEPVADTVVLEQTQNADVSLYFRI